MSEFINTIDVLGDDAVIDSIIQRTITEFKDNRVQTVAPFAFYGCTALETVHLPNATVISDCSFRSTALARVTDENFPKLTSMLGTYAFGFCENLVYFQSSTLTTVASSSRHFQGCTNLETVDVSALKEIRSNFFLNDGALKTLILRKADEITTLIATDAFSGTPIASGAGYIYVPKALVDNYKVASNWSTYASQIRAIEDYPEITGG